MKNPAIEPAAEGPFPQKLKQWISSLPAEDRCRELFENYASVHEKRKFRREGFEDFLNQLMDDVTTVR